MCAKRFRIVLAHLMSVSTNCKFHEASGWVFSTPSSWCSAWHSIWPHSGHLPLCAPKDSLLIPFHWRDRFSLAGVSGLAHRLGFWGQHPRPHTPGPLQLPLPPFRRPVLRSIFHQHLGMGLSSAKLGYVMKFFF